MADIDQRPRMANLVIDSRFLGILQNRLAIGLSTREFLAPDENQ
jgi:hypothetical protein